MLEIPLHMVRKNDRLRPRDSIIELLVPGVANDSVALRVHEGTLCKSSDYFKRMMKPEWVERRDCPNSIQLPDDDFESVSDYIKWLYAGNMAQKLYKQSEEDDRERVAEEAEKVFVLLARAYIFAEKILDMKYKNAVVRTVAVAMKDSDWSMGPESVGVVYNGTPPNSLLRRLIADNIASIAYDDTEEGVGWMTFIDGYPREALADALKATVKLRRKVETARRPSSISLEPYLEKEQ
jgi:hypothetical protein